VLEGPVWVARGRRTRELLGWPYCRFVSDTCRDEEEMLFLYPLVADLVL
jgi:hypothetical protein